MEKGQSLMNQQGDYPKMVKQQMLLSLPFLCSKPYKLYLERICITYRMVERSTADISDPR